MTDAHKMPATFRAALDAALSRPLLLDQRAYEPLLDAGGLRPRLDVMDGEEEDDVGPAPFALAGDVAVVTVEGPLSQRAWSCWMFRGDGYDAIVDRARAAFADPQARGVVLRLDSPGGEVAGCFEAVRALRAMARNAGKPLVAYVDEMACSAAYALACACDEIVAPDTGMVGSIGVIMSVASRAGELAARGVSVAVISSGKAKADGHPALPLADDARARLQADVDTLAGIFAAEVAAHGVQVHLDRIGHFLGDFETVVRVADVLRRVVVPLQALRRQLMRRRALRGVDAVDVGDVGARLDAAGAVPPAFTS